MSRLDGSLTSRELGAHEKVLVEARSQFPALGEEIHGKPLVYLDSAATTLTPQPVIDAIAECYRRGYANVNRGAHTLSERATRAYEDARDVVKEFLHAKYREELVYVRGCTEALNFVARCWGDHNIQGGDQVVVCEDAHHSNWLPWQQLCARRGALLRVVPLGKDGQLDLSAYESLLKERPRIVALTHVSNGLGAINPVRSMTSAAHAVGATVVVDGAQAVSHFPVNVQEIGCDFYAFSAHKVYGPFGVGVLYARNPILHDMPVWLTGGGMVQEVSAERSTFAAPPFKFEPGTPNISGAVGLAAALKFLQAIGWEHIEAQQAHLLSLAERQLTAVPGVTRYGGKGKRCAVISFTLQGVHPHDVSTILDHDGIAVRAGSHCAKPALRRLGIEATTRISLGIYNRDTDIEALGQALQRAREIFAS